MPASAVRQSGQSRLSEPSSKSQDVDADNHAHNQEPPDADDTESIDSDKTIDIGPEGLLRQAEDYRHRIIELGGRPTRPIAEYDKEVEEKRVMLMARTEHSRLTFDEEYYRHYCSMEMSFFHDELKAWQSFMKWFRRKWVQQNEAAGGTLPPPPPIAEFDCLNLQIQYLGFLLICRKEVEGANFVERRWNFQSYEDFLEHIVAVERHVAKLRQDQGPEDNESYKERLGHCAIVLTKWGLGDPAGFQEHTRSVKTELAAMKASKDRSSGSSALKFLQQPPTDPSSEPKLNGSKRKRQEEVETHEPDSTAKLQSFGSRSEKRRKRDVVDVELHGTVSAKHSPRRPREKTSGQTQDNATQHKLEKSKHGAADLQREIKSSPKERGRPRKQSRSSPLLGQTVQGRKQSSQKGRKRILDSSGSAKAQDGESKKRPAVIGARNEKKVAVGSGLRRSARIAARVKKEAG